MNGKGRTRTLIAIFSIHLIVLLALSSLGCGRDGTARRGEPGAGKEITEGGTGSGSQAAGHGGEGKLVHMCGRSVLAGWFEHRGWDYDPEKPVTFGDHYLLYHEMESPPGIVESALRVVEEMKPGEVLFFKLCFEDFAGGDEDTARSSLEANQRTVEKVTRAALDRGLLVLLGNALPTVAEYTDSWLTWNHRQYNRFLERLASEHPGRVAVVDLYGVLASPEGSLRGEYARDPLDSHLNDAAYEALDKAFEEALEGLLRPGS